MNTGLAAFAVTLLVGLTACSSNDTSPTDARASATVTTDTPTPSPDPLPLTRHVVTELAGFKADGRPQHQSLRAFAKAHHKTVSELAEIGLVGGVTVMFRPNAEAPGKAMSIAEQLRSPEAAQTEADRLFAANSEPDPGGTATTLEIAGIPGVQAVQSTGKFQGHPFTSVYVVFIQGTVVHELFAIGVDPLVSVPGLTDAATTLFQETHGHPLA